MVRFQNDLFLFLCVLFFRNLCTSPLNRFMLFFCLIFSKGFMFHFSSVEYIFSGKAN
jgi:hypothetical protein